MFLINPSAGEMDGTLPVDKNKLTNLCHVTLNFPIGIPFKTFIRRWRIFVGNTSKFAVDNI